jgi:hypothetical protein
MSCDHSGSGQGRLCPNCALGSLGYIDEYYRYKLFGPPIWFKD